MRNGAEAAALLSHLIDAPQENVYFLSTDSTGGGLEIHRYSRGAKNRSLVSAIEGIGHLLDQPQVARVFFVHNHPATILDEETGRELLTPSNDDRAVVNQLRKFLSLADIDLTSIVLGGNRFMEFDEWPGNDSNRLQISATTKTAKPVRLPVRERRQKATGSKTGAAINFPETAIQQFKKYGDKDGVLFVNGQNVAVDFMPWPAGYSHRQAAKMMIARAARNNAAAIILNFKEADPSWMVPGNSRNDFITKFMQALTGNLQVMDIVLNNRSMLEHRPRNNGWSQGFLRPTAPCWPWAPPLQPMYSAGPWCAISIMSSMWSPMPWPKPAFPKSCAPGSGWSLNRSSTCVTKMWSRP